MEVVMARLHKISQYLAVEILEIYGHSIKMATFPAEVPNTLRIQI